MVVGLPSSGQAASGLTDLVGHCVNLLPLKSDINPALSFTDYLKKRKKEVLDAYDHQQFTFGELIKKLYILRDPSRVTLVPVIFNIDMGMDNAVAFDGLEYKLKSNPRAYENFELFLNATGNKDGIILEWSYNTGLFKTETIEAFNKDYNAILEKIIANPDSSLAELSGREIKNDFAQGEELQIPLNQTISVLIAGTAKKYADKTAITFNKTSLTYQQLDKQVDQLASFLIQQGIKPGDIVGLSLERSMEMVICLLAVLKAGAAYLPLDPEYPLDRIEFMLEDSATKLLLTSKQYKNKYPAKYRQIVIEEIWPQLADQQLLSPSRAIDGDDLAYILYTSGSTGKPKGVKITHGNLVNLLLSIQKTPGINDADRILALTTISFDIAGAELYLPLITGAELVIADTETTKDGRLLLDIIEDKKISILQATPATWQMMLDSGWEKHYPIKAFSTGEALPKDMADKLLPRTDILWNLYGPTETTIWSTIKQVVPGEKVITIGWPINNTQVYIVDEQGKRLPAGMIGELYIGGYGVGKGYLNRPDLTDEKFVADTFSNIPGAMLYRTGDLGKLLESGEILCLGRIDQQVKIRGHRIELGEVESIIAKQTGVKQAVVIAREDTPGYKCLAAYVTLTDGSDSVTKATIQNWKKSLADTLPAYMVPDDFVALTSFPLTPNAKIDRKTLPMPQVSKTTGALNESITLTTDEKLISDIWSKILGIKNLKPSDDFFELGGHSVLAVKVMVAIEKKTKKRLPIATLFNNPTIEKLATQLSAGDRGENWDVLVPIKTTGKKEPVFLIHGAGLNILLFKSISEYFDDDQPVYGIQSLGLTREIEIPTSIEEISKRYLKEILEVSPDGPYALAGYSLGGFIAVEITRQLKEIGKEVKFLGVMDTYVGNKYYTNDNTSLLLRKIKRQFYKVPFFAKSFITNPNEAFGYQSNYVKKKVFKLRNAGVTRITDVMTDHEREIHRIYSKALDEYTLTPFDMEVTLFRVEKRLYYLDDPIYLGWNKFALKGVNIQCVPGDHKTFLEPPYSKRFAEIVQQVLDNGVVQ